MEMIKRLLGVVFEPKTFLLIFIVGLVVVLADLVSLGNIGNTDFSLGWALVFVYFFSGLAYKIFGRSS